MADELILVVDDGADMREFVINYVLEPNNYRHLEARDGLEAFELLLEHAPDMILLDLQMPRLDGIGLLKKINEEEIDIPVVLMTFYGSEEIAIEVFRLGVKDYVIKPFTDDELLDAIEKALVETRLRKERDSLQNRLVNVNQELQRQIQDQQILLRMGKIIGNLPEEEAFLRQIVEIAAAITRNERAALLLLADTDDESFIQRADRTVDGTVLSDQTILNDTALEAIRRRRATVSQPQYDAVDDASYVQICTPMEWGGDTLGVLIATSTPEEINDHQLRLLDALADYSAIGLEHLRVLSTVQRN